MGGSSRAGFRLDPNTAIPALKSLAATMGWEGWQHHVLEVMGKRDPAEAMRLLGEIGSARNLSRWSLWYQRLIEHDPIAIYEMVGNTEGEDAESIGQDALAELAKSDPARALDLAGTPEGEGWRAAIRGWFYSDAAAAIAHLGGVQPFVDAGVFQHHGGELIAEVARADLLLARDLFLATTKCEAGAR